MKPPALTLRRRLLFAAVPLVVVLALAELIARAMVWNDGPIYRMQPGIRLALEPNLSDFPIKLLRTERVFALSTNEDGLRTRHHRVVDDGGALTVVWLGDSIVLGWGVADWESAPFYLEGILAERFPGREVRVVNAGHPGYSSTQSFVLLRETAQHYAPDVVVFELAGHNLRSAAAPDSEALNVGTHTAVSLHLARASALYRLLRVRVLEQLPAAKEVVTMGSLVTNDGRLDGDRSVTRCPPGDLDELLTAAEELGLERGFRLAVSFPAMTSVAPPEHEAVVVRHAQAGKLVYLDVPARFRALSAGMPVLTLPEEPGHFTPDGNFTAARAMADALERVLTEPPGPRDAARP